MIVLSLQKIFSWRKFQIIFVRVLPEKKYLVFKINVTKILLILLI